MLVMCMMCPYLQLVVVQMMSMSILTAGGGADDVNVNVNRGFI